MARTQRRAAYKRPPLQPGGRTRNEAAASNEAAAAAGSIGPYQQQTARGNDGESASAKVSIDAAVRGNEWRTYLRAASRAKEPESDASTAEHRRTALEPPRWKRLQPAKGGFRAEPYCA